MSERAGVIALAGAPNVGKSTLLNRLVGRSLSIATAKPQTTRTRVLGVVTHGPAQLVFTDTPGIHSPRTALHERMVGSARVETRRADLACWLLAADRGWTAVDRRELAALAGRPTVIVVNKVDLVAHERVLPIIAAAAEVVPDGEFFPLSARTGEGVDALLEHLAARMPSGPWLYPADSLTDQPTRFFVAELVREQLFRQLDKELPYRVAVKVEQYEERKPKTYIEAVIFADADSVKKIIVGKEGSRIKAIGKAARKSIETFLGTPIFLQLHVRVRKDWQSDRRFLKELGL